MDRTQALIIVAPSEVCGFPTQTVRRLRDEGYCVVVRTDDRLAFTSTIPMDRLVQPKKLGQPHSRARAPGIEAQWKREQNAWKGKRP